MKLQIKQIIIFLAIIVSGSCLTNINDKRNNKDLEVILHPNTSFSLTYNPKEYEEIIKSVPEFFVEYPENPYFCYESVGKKNKHFHGGILGIDSYYSFYGHVLSKRNKNNENYSKDRDILYSLFYKLTEFYQTLNMQNGYGHVFRRIPAFAEHQIFYKDKSEIIDYDITEQKTIYFNLLKQYAKDEISNNYNFSSKERQENLLFCLNQLKQMEKLITSRFHFLALQKYDTFQLRF